MDISAKLVRMTVWPESVLRHVLTILVSLIRHTDTGDDVAGIDTFLTSLHLFGCAGRWVVVFGHGST